MAAIDSATAESSRAIRSVLGIGPLGELCGSVSRCRLAADAGDDPLPEIPAQVKHEVADGIHRFGRPPPDLLIGQLLQAVLDLLVSLRQFVSGLARQNLGDLFCSGLHGASSNG